MDNIVHTISKKLSRGGSRRFEEEEECTSWPSGGLPPSSSPPPLTGKEQDPEFKKFCATVQSFKGGPQIQERFLQELWEGADRDPIRALNHVIDIPNENIPLESVSDTIAENPGSTFGSPPAAAGFGTSAPLAGGWPQAPLGSTSSCGPESFGGEPLGGFGSQQLSGGRSGNPFGGGGFGGGESGGDGFGGGGSGNWAQAPLGSPSSCGRESFGGKPLGGFGSQQFSGGRSGNPFGGGGFGCGGSGGDGFGGGGSGGWGPFPPAGLDAAQFGRPQPSEMANLHVQLAAVEKGLASLRSCIYCGVGGAIILSAVPPERRTLSNGLDGLQSLCCLIRGSARCALHGLHVVLTHSITKVGFLCVAALAGVKFWLSVAKGNGRDLFIDIIEEMSLSGTEEFAMVRGRAEIVTSFKLPVTAKLGFRVPPDVTISKPEPTAVDRPMSTAECDVQCPLGRSDTWGGTGDKVTPVEYHTLSKNLPIEMSMAGSQEDGWTLKLEVRMGAEVCAMNVVVEIRSGDMTGPLSTPTASQGRVSTMEGRGIESKVCTWKLQSLSRRRDTRRDLDCTLYFSPSSSKPTEATLKFEVPQFNITGMRVRFAKMQLPNGRPIKWIRYFSKGCICRQFS